LSRRDSNQKFRCGIGIIALSADDRAGAGVEVKFIGFNHAAKNAGLIFTQADYLLDDAVADDWDSVNVLSTEGTDFELQLKGDFVIRMNARRGVYL
jgi:hypothetical protein